MCDLCFRSIVLPKVKGGKRVGFLKRESGEAGEINAKQPFELYVMLHVFY